MSRVTAPALGLVLASCLTASRAAAQGDVPDSIDGCSASCPLGERCDASGYCVPHPDAGEPADPGSDFADEPGAGAYTHDGFLLRVTLGLAGAWLAESADVPVFGAEGSGTAQLELDASGVGLWFTIDAGFSISPSFAWQVRLAQCMVPDPTLEGESPEGRGDPTRRVVLLGPGLAWFGPVGLYANAVAGIAFSRVQAYDGEGEDGPGDPGYGANVDLGMAFWIAEQFTLGGVVSGMWTQTFGSHTDGDRAQRGWVVGGGVSLAYH